MKISVIGLGKLGLCTAACFASAGHSVYGYDSNAGFRSELKARRSPVDETGLQDLLDRSWPQLHITDSPQEAVESSDISLIIVPTPSGPDGRFSNNFVLGALEELASALARKETFHVVDVVSTVMPGSCEKVFRPLLDRLTGKTCGCDIGLAYNPEFIALGSVIRNFLNPDLVLIGASDARTGSMLTELYRSTCRSDPAISVLTLINAEIAKISLNCYVTMKISYANALAELCERVPGADIDAVTDAIGTDSRVGDKCLKGGLGFGGPCFPRDNLAFQSFAEEHGAEATLGKSVVAINNGVPNRLFERIRAEVPPPSRVALLGLSYKADTHIIEESQGVLLAQQLQRAGYRLSLHDPKALTAVAQTLGAAATCAATPYEAVRDADVIVLLTDWPEYRRLDWNRIREAAASRAVVIDCWRTLRQHDLGDLGYLPLGIGLTRSNLPR